MTDPINLGRERAARTNDSRSWKPREVLTALLAEIDSGRLDVESLFIIYAHKNAAGTSEGYLCSNQTVDQSIAMLATALQVNTTRRYSNGK